MDKYEKEEFLIDADMEFYKVKKLLEKNPKMLRDDPVLSIDYHKIITLIRQKKLFENTSDHFNPDNAYKVTWNDVNDIKRTELKAQQALMKKYRLSQSGGVEGGDGSSDALTLNEEDTSSSVKNSKKQELRQKRAIIGQFDKIASGFTASKRTSVGKDATITARDGA